MFALSDLQPIKVDMTLALFLPIFGKPLVVCMQTGRSTLLDPNDLDDIDYLKKVFKMDNHHQAQDLSEFFRAALPRTHYETQYE